jgi:hypothetical protein
MFDHGRQSRFFAVTVAENRLDRTTRLFEFSGGKRRDKIPGMEEKPAVRVLEQADYASDGVQIVMRIGHDPDHVWNYTIKILFPSFRRIVFIVLVILF